MQITSTLLLWAVLGQSVLAGVHYAPLAASPRQRSVHAERSPAEEEQILSCTETYGSGSMACGKPELKLCFNPGAGESCCGMDGGFCKAGWHCAPVPSYCCKDGEDLETCARNAGFQLPSVSAILGPDESVTATPSASSGNAITTTTTTSSASTLIQPISLSGVAISNSSAVTALFNNSTALSVPAVVVVAAAAAVTTTVTECGAGTLLPATTTPTTAGPFTIAQFANVTANAASTIATVPTISQFAPAAVSNTLPVAISPSRSRPPQRQR
ncbi:hypothetical protein MN608_04727 [Microdochium nivale]|nr:hypothetical protein MN608_04727 [Microdochium nivale]